MHSMRSFISTLFLFDEATCLSIFSSINAILEFASLFVGVFLSLGLILGDARQCFPAQFYRMKKCVRLVGYYDNQDGFNFGKNERAECMCNMFVKGRTNSHVMWENKHAVKNLPTMTFKLTLYFCQMQNLNVIMHCNSRLSSTISLNTHVLCLLLSVEIHLCWRPGVYSLL